MTRATPTWGPGLRRPKPSASDVLSFVVATLLLTLLTPYLILSELGTNSDRSHAWVITLGILVYSGIRMSVLLAAGKPEIFQFVFWLFTYVFFGISPTVQIISGDISSTTPGIPHAYDTPTAVVIATGIFSFEIGLFFRKKEAKPTYNSSQVDISTPRAVVLAAFGVVFFAYGVGAIGFSSLFLNRGDLVSVKNGAWGDSAQYAVLNSLAFVPVLVASQALFQKGIWLKKRQKKAAHYFAWGGLLAIPAFTYINPISSPRYYMGTVYGSYLGALGGFASKARTRISLALLAFAFVFVFPIADFYRNATARSGVENRETFVSEYLGNGDYDAFWTLSNSLRFVEDQGITWGNQLLGVLFFWVPRSIWNEKALDTGVLLAQHQGYGFTNLSAPLWAEAYVNFGLIGVIVCFFALGRLFVRLDRSATAAFSNGGHSAIAASILPLYCLILLRGSLLQATGMLVIILFSILFVRQTSRNIPEGTTRVL